MSSIGNQMRVGLRILSLADEWLALLKEAAEQMGDKDPEQVMNDIEAASAAGLAAAKAYLATKAKQRSR